MSSVSPLLQNLNMLSWNASRSFIILDNGLGVSLVAGVTLLNERKSDSLASWEGDDWLLAIANNEDVRKTGGKGVAMGVLDVGDFVRTGVVFDVLEDTDTTDVVSAGSEDEGAVIEFDDSVNLTSLKVKL